MTSLLSGQRQTLTDGGYYINLGDLRGLILNRSSEGSGNTGTNGGSFSTASWSFSTMSPGSGWVSTSLASIGKAVLRDMGRTVVSSSRTFRKIQLVVPQQYANSTFGVSGTTTTGEAYYTGYIELGLGEGTPSGWTPTPVAHYGR